MTTKTASKKTSALASLMDWLQSTTTFLLSFEDLSGITYDYPQLSLPERLRRHVRPFCDFAKHNIKGSHQCPLNKALGNRAAIDQGDAPLTGCCYLGLTDICRALWYENRVMGVFYFGSVIRNGELDQARNVIRDRFAHQPALKASLLRRINHVPVVSNTKIEDAIAELERFIQTLELMLAGLAIPVGLYETYQSNRLVQEAWRLTHPLVHRALRMIQEHHDQPLNLSVIASEQRCHPGYLSRLFRQQMGMTVSVYLRQTRIHRACRLLKLGRLDVTAVGLEVGFDDKSNFGRAFRQVMQMSPGQYQEHITDR